jgi:RNA polymerase sigma-70 factor, ECF subfamily
LSPQEHLTFLKLINEHRAVVHKVVNLYVDDFQQREDLVQEVVFQALKGFPGFRQESKFSTWLYRVSLNTVFSFVRKENKRKEAELGIESEQYVDLPDDAAAELYFHIRRLDEVNRMIITLHLEGFGNNEIAEITGATPNSIGVRLHRIRETLTKKMNHIR